MLNKKVLIVTPFFAPESHAAVYRAHKLVKYLSRNGWEPIVLTVNINYLYSEDPLLLDELSDIPVCRAKYIEPSLRGLRMALGGRDRTYKAQKNDGNKKISEDYKGGQSLLRQCSLLEGVYDSLLNNYLQSPDRYWTWERNAVLLGKKIIKQHKIGVVYTTCLPFTCNVIGWKLKKYTGVKWVADFRDPITYAKRMYSDNYRIFLRQKKIQDKTFQYADAITGLSSSYGLIFHDQYEGRYAKKYTFIPTGIDDDYIPRKKDYLKEENVITFVGEYLSEYKDYFLRIYKQAIIGINDRDIPRLVIVGNTDINKKNALRYINELDLSHLVEFKEFLPQRELYKYLLCSKYVVLLSGDMSLWWVNFAKLVDYIALERKILAFVPDISEAKSELTKAGLGIFLSNDNSGVEKLRRLFINEDLEGTNVNSDYCQKYTASSQAASFIEIFKKIQGE